MRDLPMYGKVAVFKAQTTDTAGLPSLFQTILKKVEPFIFKYLWNNKPDQIKGVTVQADKEDSDLCMPNTQNKDKSLKIAWIKRLMQCPESHWVKMASSPITTRRKPNIQGKYLKEGHF